MQIPREAMNVQGCCFGSCMLLSANAQRSGAFGISHSIPYWIVANLQILLNFERLIRKLTELCSPKLRRSSRHLPCEFELNIQIVILQQVDSSLFGFTRLRDSWNYVNDHPAYTSRFGLRNASSTDKPLIFLLAAVPCVCRVFQRLLKAYLTFFPWDGQQLSNMNKHQTDP